MKKRIIPILLCMAMLLTLCGCVDTISTEEAAKPVSQYYFEDVCQAGGRFYFTTYTDEEPERTILLCDDTNYNQTEICRFEGTVHIDYVGKSYDSSKGEKMLFYVRPDIGSGRLYSYTIADNSIKIFLREDCSNMIPDTSNDGTAWVIKDDKLVCVNMENHSIVEEHSRTIEELNLTATFPNGFFGGSGDCNIEISMKDSIIHVKAHYGSKVDNMTVKEADIDTALIVSRTVV